MSMFWPSNIELSDTEAPMEILETARKDWETESGGVLTLLLQEAESQSGHHMVIVHAKHVPSNRTATLFSVVHRPSAPYPVTIQPKDDALPVFLQKSYYQPAFSSIAATMGMVQGRQVTNKWVSDTPSEFRAKLSEVFNLGVVKCEILSLVSNAPAAQEQNEKESGEEKNKDQ